ncbi:hypothetical protein [Methanolobus chelungpuianus]|uniref:Uncharacterized protein n=1 Tax=Methanolobus chelungpuianus TaxID=502115 RepID=A0AAE3HCC3_9EURY|nr:hypothetical protein [Methanolobus chelungpuianus]MCQ6963509.1 hypothetical protein [Methanolobus chelungpuianus]
MSGISRVTFQIVFFVLFSLAYVLLVNIYFMQRGSGNWVFVPGTLLVGLVGYWIAGYLYKRYFMGVYK